MKERFKNFERLYSTGLHVHSNPVYKPAHNKQKVACTAHVAAAIVIKTNNRLKWTEFS